MQFLCPNQISSLNSDEISSRRQTLGSYSKSMPSRGVETRANVNFPSLKITERCPHNTCVRQCEDDLRSGIKRIRVCGLERELCRESQLLLFLITPGVDLLTPFHIRRNPSLIRLDGVYLMAFQ